MKKIICLITMLLACLTLSIGLAGCGSAKSYNVILNAGEGSNIEFEYIKVVEGKEYSLKTPSKVGYDFDAWYDKDDNKIESQGKWNYGDIIEIYAKFTPKKYTLSLDTNGGTLPLQEYFVYYDRDYTLPTPEKKGYTFANWKIEDEVFASEGKWKYDEAIPLKADYTPNPYKVNYQTEVGTLSKTTENVIYDSQIEFADIDYEEKEYNFLGWKISGTQTILTEAPEKWTYNTEITLIAQFERIPYTITFDAVDGSVDIAKKVIYYNDSYELPTPTKKGYHLVSWKNGQDNVAISGDKWQIGESITLVAEYAPNSYKVNYQSEVGTLSKTTENIIYDSKIAFANIDYEEKEYNFLGWKISGTEIILTEAPEKWTYNTEITLIAQFERIVYTISFKKSADVLINSKTGYYNEEITLPQPTRKGYTFDGYTYLGATQNYKASTWVIKDNIELEPKWIANKCTVTLNAGEGTINNSKETTIEVEYGKDLSVLSSYIPVLENKEFTCWSYNNVPIYATDIWNYDVENAVFVAKFKGALYSFNLVSEIENSLINQTFAKEYGTPYTLDELQDTIDKRFVGWSYNGEIVAQSGIWEIIPTEDNNTLVAVWEDRKIIVNFDTQTEQIVVSCEIKYSDDITFITPTREDYNFLGWFYNGEKVTNVKEIWQKYPKVDEITLVALWEDGWPEIEI